MLNKRILIKNLLSHNDENTFYEKKESLDLNSDKGKGKFLKHICALSNSNPYNNSFLIVGVANKTNEIKGSEFIDDSVIQNLVSAYLSDPPILKYENIYFPNLPKDRVIGLLTISPTTSQTSFRKNIGDFSAGTLYHRKGSNSIPTDSEFSMDSSNPKTVSEIEKYSMVSLKELLDDIFEFYDIWDKEYFPQYLVFKDQYVICWAGYHTNHLNLPIFTEVDIRIVNEATRLFYSAGQWVDVKISDSEFIIIEYKVLGFDYNYKLYPFEETKLVFHDNGQYVITTQIIFVPPKFESSIIQDLYIRSKTFEERILKGAKIDEVKEFSFYEGLANYFLICYLNGIPEAKNDLINSLRYLDGAAAEWQSECVEILEKLEKQ